MVVVEAVFLTVFWGWVVSAVLFLRNTILPRLPVTYAPEALNLPSETVSFQSTDGLRLEGWKIPSDPTRPWIILCHGVGSNRSDLLDIAAGLHSAGLNLLLFDFRGHGGSAGRATSFGWQEQHDLEGALAFLGSLPEIPPRPHGVYGISMGGAAALMVAAQDERVGAVAADSLYTNLEDSLARHLTLLYPYLPKIPFLWFVLATYRLRFGVWPKQVSPQDAAARLGLRPLFLIHGEADSRMPIDRVKAMSAVASGPKSMWVIQGAGHLEAFALDPQVYLARLVNFFHSSMR